MQSTLKMATDNAGILEKMKMMYSGKPEELKQLEAMVRIGIDTFDFASSFSLLNARLASRISFVCPLNIFSMYLYLVLFHAANHIFKTSPPDADHPHSASQN
jgi:hypothetical protein